MPARITVLPFLFVPCDTQLRSKVEVGLVHAVAEAAVELIVELVQGRERTEVTVGAAGVAHIAQTGSHGKVGLDLPGISDVPGETVIRTHSAGRQPKCMFDGKESYPVTQRNVRVRPTAF